MCVEIKQMQMGIIVIMTEKVIGWKYETLLENRAATNNYFHH